MKYPKDVTFGAPPPRPLPAQALAGQELEQRKFDKTEPADKRAFFDEVAAFQGLSPCDLPDEVMCVDPATWPARDQTGWRGTCTAFSTLAELEWHRAAGDGSKLEDLSEEYVYSKMRRDLADLLPEPGVSGGDRGATFLGQAALALVKWGVPTEEDLPYQGPKPHPAWSVSDTAPYDAAAQDRKQAAGSYLNVFKDIGGPVFGPGFSALIKANLAAGLTVNVALPTYREGIVTVWNYGIGWDTGAVPDPAADPLQDTHLIVGGHSFLIVGYVEDASTGGQFIFRNSWGRRFARRHHRHETLGTRLAPGYGAISGHHLDAHCWEAVFRKR